MTRVSAGHSLPFWRAPPPRSGEAEGELSFFSHKRSIAMKCSRMMIAVFPLLWSQLAQAQDDDGCVEITEIRANAIGSDTTGPEGEWFELQNVGDDDDCVVTIVGSTDGRDDFAWKFVEGKNFPDPDHVNHQLPNENVTIHVLPGEVIIFAAFPERFHATYPGTSCCRVFDIVNRPGFGNTRDFLEIRNSRDDGFNLIDRVEWSFSSSISSTKSIQVLSDGSLVQAAPTPCAAPSDDDDDGDDSDDDDSDED